MQTCSSTSSLQTNEEPLAPLPLSEKKSKQATTSKKAPELKCKWSADEEERLILFLLSVDLSGGTADTGNFKQVMWNAAALEMTKFPTNGPNKTLKVCLSKYSLVYIHLCYMFIRD